MRCEICRSKLRKVESSLVCDNGHIIQNAEEVCDDFVPPSTSARSRKVKKMKARKKSERELSYSVRKALVVHCLFYEAMQYFKFSDDWVYKQLTGFFTVICPEDTEDLQNIRPGSNATSNVFGATQPEVGVGGLGSRSQKYEAFNSTQPRPPQEKQTSCLQSTQGCFDHSKTKLYGEYNLNYCYLVLAIYLSKRMEEEKKNRPFFMKDFYVMLSNFHAPSRIVDILARQRLDRIMWRGLAFSTTAFSLMTFERIIHFIGDYDRFAGIYRTHDTMHETGVIPQYVADIKQNIRSVIRRDLEMWMMYFDEVVREDLKIEKTEELEFYFRKLVYTLHPKKMYIPEVVIGLFIAAYYNNKDMFEDTPLEVRVLSMLQCTRLTLKLKLDDFTCLMDHSVSPEAYTRRLMHDTRRAFRNFKFAIYIIDKFKKARNSSLLPGDVNRKEGEGENGERDTMGYENGSSQICSSLDPTSHEDNRKKGENGEEDTMGYEKGSSQIYSSLDPTAR